ncbi:MAG: phosphoribosylglycinamide formyltransferase [Flavobacteriaceae bacterium]|nr:phosphoribosylglycinamide formyltransferase [Flavobacteriaceae bacterium]
MKKRIVIFASGSGTNAQNIINHFKQSKIAEVVQVLSNNEHAKVLKRAEASNIETSAFSKEALFDENGVLVLLKNLKPDLIVLAGFLLKFPETILNAFPNKVINIHPALLPKYGGKGMYGKYVHEAVVANAESESGITIHYVNKNYDEGAIIFQATVALEKEDTATVVAEKVQKLEHEFFPKVIESLLIKTDTNP